MFVPVICNGCLPAELCARVGRFYIIRRLFEQIYLGVKLSCALSAVTPARFVYRALTSQITKVRCCELTKFDTCSIASSLCIIGYRLREKIR